MDRIKVKFTAAAQKALYQRRLSGLPGNEASMGQLKFSMTPGSESEDKPEEGWETGEGTVEMDPSS